jgi:uncharacterized phiE125 gp8 family phage protein
MYNFYDPQTVVQSIRNWQYDQISDPPVTPIDINDLKAHARLDYVEGIEESYLNLLIQAVTHYVENYTGRSLITRQWRTYRDCFDSKVIEIRRPPFQELLSFKYYNGSGILTDIGLPPSTLYYLTSEVYPKIVLYDGQWWASDVQNRMQAIIIEFSAGYGTNKNNIPEDLKMGMLNHAAYLYENRGDAERVSPLRGNDLIEAAAVISGARAFYDKYRIVTLLGNTYFTYRDSVWI